MAGSKSPLAFPSLQKYTRKRQLFAKNGFYLAINSTGEVTGTSDGSCLYGKKTGNLGLACTITLDIVYSVSKIFLVTNIAFSF